jgi:hypothetical protein
LKFQKLIVGGSQFKDIKSTFLIRFAIRHSLAFMYNALRSLVFIQCPLCLWLSSTRPITYRVKRVWSDQSDSHVDMKNTSCVTFFILNRGKPFKLGRYWSKLIIQTLFISEVIEICASRGHFTYRAL